MTLNRPDADKWLQELIDIDQSECSYKERYKRLQLFFNRLLKSLVDPHIAYTDQYTMLDAVTKQDSLFAQLKQKLFSLRNRLIKCANRNEQELHLKFYHDLNLLIELIQITRGEATTEDIKRHVSKINQEAQKSIPSTPTEVNEPLVSTVSYDNPQKTNGNSTALDSDFEGRGQIIVRELRVRVVTIMTDRLSVCLDNHDEVNSEFKDPFEVTWINGTDHSPFNSISKEIWTGAVLNLVNVRQSKGNGYLVDYFVIEPDYLIDISSLAECFQSYTTSSTLFITNRLKESVNSGPIRIGNVVNTFFDALVYENSQNRVTVNDLLAKIFNESPIELAACPDLQTEEDSRRFFEEVKKQFNHLAKVTRSKLNEPEYAVDLSKAYVEPSFLCPSFGVQGRFDFLMIDNIDNKTVKRKAVIIELKSGKTPFGDTKGTAIGENHAAQIALYRLVTEQNLSIDYRNITNYILYSKIDDKNLRQISFPLVRLQKLIAIRNKIVVEEHRLVNSEAKDLIKVHFGLIADLIEELAMNPTTLVKNYILPSIISIYKQINSFSELERAYFSRYYQFIARESYLSKCSDFGGEISRSQSSLWLNAAEQKEEAGELLSDLEVIREAGENDAATICFAFKKKRPDEISNFRENDIILLYHQEERDSSVVNQIVFKGIIKEISDSRIWVKLRYRQKREDLFKEGKLFTLERDFMDHSFTQMYRGLYAFLSHGDTEMKELFLGLKKPQFDETIKLVSEPDPGLRVIVEQAVRNSDYYLLEGPPGTGKTSRAMKAMIKEFSDSGKIILLLAYTNRAVDEICQVLDDQGGLGLSYIRLGSSLSSSENSQPRLLENVIAHCKRRDEVREVIDNHKIFVGTVASLSGKSDLFLLKSFDVAILDEASQVLEPQLLGLISSKNASGERSIRKWIMIGDQKQLPAIVIQPKSMTKVFYDKLYAIGLFDCRSSLFERLLFNVRRNSWQLALGTLVKQGRMHQMVSKLPNQLFYRGELEVADPTRQLAEYGKYSVTPVKEGILSVFDQRLAFLDTIKESDFESVKTSLNEAKVACKLVLALYNHSLVAGIEFDPEKTVGIIAPYRRQIALIRNLLYESGFKYAREITIDTIERFQGSQREVIIYSMCINNLSQVNALSEERIRLQGEDIEIDRKLNVALTRAREYMVIVGNAKLMRYDEILNELVSHYETNGGFFPFSEVKRLFLD